MLSSAAPEFIRDSCSLCEKTYSNGQKYVGSWKNDEKNGTGTYTWPNGQKYVGSFKNGDANGTGTWTWPSGQKYVGSYKNGKRHGTGTMTYSNGQKYVGSFKNGDENGTGTYTWPRGQKYVGSYKNGKRHGTGTMTYSNGQKYVGSWKNGKRHGTGTYTYVDGKYVGSWKNNEFDTGTREMIHEGKKYSFVFLDGKELSEKEGKDYLQKQANEERIMFAKLCANEAKDAKTEYAAKKIESTCLEGYGYGDNKVFSGFKILKIFYEPHRTMLISYIFEALASSALLFFIIFKLFEKNQVKKLSKKIIFYGAVGVAIATGTSRSILIVNGINLVGNLNRGDPGQLLVFAVIPIIFSFILYKIIRNRLLGTEFFFKWDKNAEGKLKAKQYALLVWLMVVIFKSMDIIAKPNFETISTSLVVAIFGGALFYAITYWAILSFSKKIPKPSKKIIKSKK